MRETFEMVAKTLYGLEEILAGELLSLGANDIQIGRRMVSFTGDKETIRRPICISLAAGWFPYPR